MQLTARLHPSIFISILGTPQQVIHCTPPFSSFHCPLTGHITRTFSVAYATNIPSLFVMYILTLYIPSKFMFHYLKVTGG